MHAYHNLHILAFFQAFFCMLAFGSEDPAVAALLRNRLFGITQHSRGRRKVRRLQ